MNFTQEQIDTAYEKLPLDISAVIYSTTTATTLYGIAKQFSLDERKLNDLASETGFVMVGLTTPDTFVTNITQKISVSEEIARKIAEEVNVRIFRPVRDSIRKMQDISMKGTQKKPETKSLVQTFPQQDQNTPPWPISTVSGFQQRPDIFVPRPQETQKNILMTPNKTSTLHPNEPSLKPTPQNITSPNQKNQEKSMSRVWGEYPASVPQTENKMVNSQSTSWDTSTPDSSLPTEDINREKILAEIENPTPLEESGSDLLTRKLSGTITVPRKEIELSPITHEKKETLTNTHPDPYREPLS